MWFDAEGHRMSAPDYPGFDTLHVGNYYENGI